MFSVFFHMSEFITNVLFSIVERIVMGKKPAFVEEYRLTFAAPNHGWVMGAVGDYMFAEYRGRNILFRPKLSLLHETDTVRGLGFIRQPTAHERVYVTWREAASDGFFKDVETLFKRAQKQKKVATGE